MAQHQYFLNGNETNAVDKTSNCRGVEWNGSRLSGNELIGSFQ